MFEVKMRDYIASANRFMYDSNYIVESNKDVITLNGKTRDEMLADGWLYDKKYNAFYKKREKIENKPIIGTKSRISSGTRKIIVYTIVKKDGKGVESNTLPGISLKDMLKHAGYDIGAK
jgi:hypothetical protein